MWERASARMFARESFSAPAYDAMPKAKKPELKKRQREEKNRKVERNPPRPLISAKALIILIVVIAFGMRMIYLLQAGDAPEFALLVGDAVTYDAWAARIAGGDWLGQGVFYQAPLYPYFLGTLYTLFGKNMMAVRLVQIVLGAGSCLLLASAGRSFFGRTATGLMAGAMLAVYPTAIFFDGSIQKSVLDLFFVCALLAVLGGLLERPRNRWWAAAGAILGLLALTRENALLFLPIVLAWLFIAWRSEPWKTRLNWAALVLMGIAAMLLPVGFRNLTAGGEFHLTTAQFGPNFYIGNSRTATGFYEPLRQGRAHALFEREDATILAQQAAGRELTPSEVSNYWAAKAMEDIRADVYRWLRLMYKKWLLVWNVREVADSDDQYTAGDWSPLLGLLNRMLHFGILCPLMVLGICLTWNRRRRLWLLYAMILGYAGSVALFYVFSRYRFPLVPLLVLFAAAGLTFLRDAFREPRRRALWTGAATAVLTAVFCCQDMVSEAHIRAGAHTNLGNAFTMEGKTEDAIGQYKLALQLKPDDSLASINLATVMMNTGRLKEAIGYFEQALSVNPDDSRVNYSLGIALGKLGHPNRAIGYFEKALQIDPDFAEAHLNLGVALERLGRPQDAMAHYQRAVQLKPDFAEARYNWSNSLLRKGRFDEAVRNYEQALRIQPDYAEVHCNLGIALEQLGRLQDAIEHYEQAVRLRPDFSQVKQRLAQLRAGRPPQQEAR